MVKARKGAARVGVWVATACLLVGGTRPAQAAPTVAQMLSFRPRQEGVVITTPAADKQADCKVELVKGSGRGSGWVLKDENGGLLRKFFDSNDDNHIDVWSYYKDGVEVYSEIDTTFSGKPDQYRWFNSGGMKWGVDEAKDGRIKYWKVISPEEVSQELLQALIAHDLTRFQALLISEAEIKAVGFSTEQANRIREQVKAAPEKFQDAIVKLTKLSPKANWIHLETSAPQCATPDAPGGAEVIKHARGTILFDVGGANDWIQTGEMVQVGVNSWRLVSGPVPGSAPPESFSGGTGVVSDPEVQKLVEKLTKLDQQAPANSPGPSAEVMRHYLARADVLEAIVAKVKPQEREPWIRQVADSLGTAAQASPPGDSTALERLRNLEAQLVKYMPGHNLTAYITFREMQADLADKVNKKKDFNTVQTEWMERLAKFVQAYPRAEDTPDALLQAGMAAEFLNKEVEAKNWYGQLVKNYSDKPQAKKAEGSIRRIDLEGKPFKLAGPLLADTNVAFDIDQLAGKAVLVYYWASYNNNLQGDFAKLKSLLDTYGPKGLEVVCVNLDTDVETAQRVQRTMSPVGTHLYQKGGLEGKLATDYGITMLPNLFLVGKDGKVVNRSAQIANVDEDLKKLLK
jgi:glutathione peroxidase-family protein